MVAALTWPWRAVLGLADWIAHGSEADAPERLVGLHHQTLCGGGCGQPVARPNEWCGPCDEAWLREDDEYRRRVDV